MSEITRPSVDLPTDQELVLKVVPMPADCNANGDIFAYQDECTLDEQGGFHESWPP